MDATVLTVLVSGCNFEFHSFNLTFNKTSGFYILKGERAGNVNNAILMTTTLLQLISLFESSADSMSGILLSCSRKSSDVATSHVM